jgi:hypothetical protein
MSSNLIYQIIQSKNFSTLYEYIKDNPEELKQFKNEELILDLTFSDVSFSQYRLECFKFFINENFKQSEKLFSWICAHGFPQELDFYLSKKENKDKIHSLEFNVGVKNCIINGAYHNLVVLFKEFNYNIPSYFLTTSIERSLMTDYPKEIISLVLNKIGYIDNYTYDKAIKTNEYHLDEKLHLQLMSQYEKQNIEKQIKSSTINNKKIKI